MTFLRWGFRLLLIQLFFVVIVWLASYFRGLEIAFAIIYLYVVWQAGKRIPGESLRPGWNLLLTGGIAQLPGLMLTVINIFYYLGLGDIAVDYPYFFQLWHTPFLPFLSLCTFPVFQGLKSSFAALFTLSPIYIIILGMPYLVSRIRKGVNCLRRGPGRTAG